MGVWADYFSPFSTSLLSLPSPPSTVEPFSAEALAEREAQACQEQSRQRWESLRLELRTKLQLLHKTLEQEQQQPVRPPLSGLGLGLGQG